MWKFRGYFVLYFIIYYLHSWVIFLENKIDQWQLDYQPFESVHSLYL
jgi:hypothetical protein